MSFMKQAIILAKKAKAHEDVPIGAVIVKDGKVIAKAENQVQKKKNPLLHAEMIAIEKACKKLDSKFLDGCDIYVSLEPCAMCATALSFAKIRKIYFAASDEKGGGIVNNAKVYQTDRHLWKPEAIQCKEYAEESGQLLKDFFKERRKK